MNTAYITPTQNSLSIKIPNEFIGKKLEVSYKIADEISLNSSPAIEGKPLSKKEFASWVERAEKAPSISLKESKKLWDKMKKEMLSNIK